MFTFIETRLFSRLADEFCPMISWAACSIISMRTRRPVTPFESRVVFGNCGGAQRVEESAVGFELFTTCDRSKARSGCSRSMRRMLPRAFRVGP